MAEQQPHTNFYGAAHASFVPLSEHEARVVNLLAEGLEPVHIAEELGTTPGAVHGALEQLARRLQVAHRGDASP